MSTLRGASGDQKGWSREFDDPIPTGDGGELRSLRDAGVSLPPAEAEREHWHVAMEALAGGQHRYTGVKSERIEGAIADDLAFLAAHPIRHNKSEAMARRREFKEAMRRRIRDVGGIPRSFR